VDERADLYAPGVMLYEVTTGALPLFRPLHQSRPWTSTSARPYPMSGTSVRICRRPSPATQVCPTPTVLRSRIETPDLREAREETVVVAPCALELAIRSPYHVWVQEVTDMLQTGAWTCKSRHHVTCNMPHGSGPRQTICVICYVS
jgi:hypothetical protein